MDRAGGAARRNRVAAVVLGTATGLGAGVGATPQGDRALGEYLSSECVTCHQLTGTHKGIPPIIGWPDESFISIMTAYKMRARDNPVMQNIATKLSDEDIAALAAYFGSLKPR